MTATQPDLSNDESISNQSETDFKSFYKKFDVKYAHHFNLSTHITKLNTGIIQDISSQKGIPQSSYDFIRVCDNNDFGYDKSATGLCDNRLNNGLAYRTFNIANPNKYRRISSIFTERSFGFLNSQQIKTLTGEYNIDFNSILTCEGLFEFLIYMYDLLYHNPDEDLIELYHDFIINSLSIIYLRNGSTEKFITISHFSDIFFTLIKKEKDMGRFDIPYGKYKGLSKLENKWKDGFDQTITENTKLFNYVDSTCDLYNKNSSIIRHDIPRIQYKMKNVQDSKTGKIYPDYNTIFSQASDLFENILKNSNYATIIEKGLNPLKDDSVIKNVKECINSGTVLTVINPTYSFVDWSNIKQFNKKHNDVINDIHHYILDQDPSNHPNFTHNQERWCLRSIIESDSYITKPHIRVNEMLVDFMDLYSSIFSESEKYKDSELFCLMSLKGFSPYSSRSRSMLVSPIGMRTDKNDFGKSQFENYMPPFLVNSYLRQAESSNSEQKERLDTYYNGLIGRYVSYPVSSNPNVCRNIDRGHKKIQQVLVNINPNKKHKLEQLKLYFKDKNIDVKVNNKVHHTELEQQYPFIVNFSFDNYMERDMSSNTGLEKLDYMFMMLSRYYDRINFKFNISQFYIGSNGRLFEREQNNKKYFEFIRDQGKKTLYFYRNRFDMEHKTYFDIFDFKNIKPMLNPNKDLIQQNYELFSNLFYSLFDTDGLYGLGIMVQTDSRKFLNMAKLGDIKPKYIKINLENIDEIHEAAVEQNQI